MPHRPSIPRDPSFSLSPDALEDLRFDILARLPIPADYPDEPLAPIGMPVKMDLEGFLEQSTGVSLVCSFFLTGVLWGLPGWTLLTTLWSFLYLLFPVEYQKTVSCHFLFLSPQITDFRLSLDCATTAASTHTKSSGVPPDRITDTCSNHVKSQDPVLPLLTSRTRILCSPRVSSIPPPDGRRIARRA